MDSDVTSGRIPSRRLLIVSNFYPPHAIGGAEIVAHRHALLMKARGWTVSVFAGVLPSADRPPGTVHVDSHDGIEVIRLALRSLELDENFRWALADNVLTALIAANRPEWLHAHNITGLGVDLIGVARRAGIPVAVTLHDNWGYCFKNTRLRNNGDLCRDVEECHLCRPTVRADRQDLPIRMRRDYVRWRLNQADVLVSPSKDLAARYVEGGFAPGRILVQSNGIDLAAIPARVRTPEQVRFLCAAYMGEHKGIPVLLRALDVLAASPHLADRWSLTIAGHGHLAPEVERAIEDNGWSGSVTFVGRRSREQIMRLLLQSDVVILPSSWPENEPVILMEAIASGAALLASRLGGNTELVRDGQTGLLFEPGNPHDLARAMRQLIEVPASVAQFSQANLATRDTLDEHIAADHMHSIFAAPPRPPVQGRDCPAIICGGRADAKTTILISLLAKIVPDVQLLWHEWLHPADWEYAQAYWHWSANDALEQIMEPLKRGMPVIMADGPLALAFDAACLPVHRYAGARQLGAAIHAACAVPRPQTSVLTAAHALQRFDVALRPSGSFRMPGLPLTVQG